MAKRKKDTGYEDSLSAEEFWQFHKSQKYTTLNPISQKLVDGFFRNLYQLINSTLEDCQTYLEVGCGPGESSIRIMEKLSNKHFEISDFDERFSQIYNEMSYPLQFTQESVYELKRVDNSFDCIFLLEVLEHLDDYEKALEEIFRVGHKYVIISVPNEPLWSMMNFVRLKYWKRLGNTPGHINNWNANKFKQLVNKYGDIQQFARPIPWQMALLKVR